MKFAIDDDKKIIFGLSGKCGCTHVKRIFLYLSKNMLDVKNPHIPSIFGNKLPTDFFNYKIFIFIRNPYHRIISGFLDKYRKDVDNYEEGWKSFRPLWLEHNNYYDLTFKNFVNAVCLNNKGVERWHFSPQTSEYFNLGLLTHGDVFVYDINHIDYFEIEHYFDKPIPDAIRANRGCYTRPKVNHFDGYFGDYHIDDVFDLGVDYKLFYDRLTMMKVKSFYDSDFKIFKYLGINYENNI